MSATHLKSETSVSLESTEQQAHFVEGEPLRQPACPTCPPTENAVGAVVGWDKNGYPLVVLKNPTSQYFDADSTHQDCAARNVRTNVNGGVGIKSGITARTVLPMRSISVGQDVVLAFENNDSRKPIILGVLQSPESAESISEVQMSGSPLEVSKDGQRVSLSAEQEIVLQCGDASITLTKSGKIILRGAYLLSRSSGANCIRGGSVQIN